MERGAVLLLDEVDRATNKIMCLQGILEGKPVLVKKTGEVVEPSPGFNVIATANTKGKGSEDGRFTAASIIDDAFLERFTVAIDQAFPSQSVENKIVAKHMEKFGKVDVEFATKLVSWADIIRKTFYDDGVDEVISTRRLCHIVQTFSIFDNKMKAIELCIARFDDDTKAAFLDLYTKVDSGVTFEDETTTEDTYETV
jgi:MoxR-like ATPase